MPLLSVLTPVHGNRADLLVEAGKSLADQVLPDCWDLEWIVQEDGDGHAFTEAIAVFDFARHDTNRARLGPSPTRNLALARARGGLVRVLDSDDLVLPGGLAVALDAFAAHPHIHWTGGPADDLMPDGSRVRFEMGLPTGIIEPGTLTDYVLAHRCQPVHAAGLTMRTGTVRALGGWAGIPRAGDNSLLIAIAELSPGYLAPEVTWLYRRHDGQITRSPGYSALDPISETIVDQRIAALRKTGLRLVDRVEHLNPTGKDPDAHPCR